MGFKRIDGNKNITKQHVKMCYTWVCIILCFAFCLLFLTAMLFLSLRRLYSSSFLEIPLKRFPSGMFCSESDSELRCFMWGEDEDETGQYSFSEQIDDADEASRQSGISWALMYFETFWHEVDGVCNVKPMLAGLLGYFFDPSNP